MIEFFRSWCEGIIVAVLIAIIIETILPEDSIKKYVKVVIGIYIIYTILNPLLGKINTDINFGNIEISSGEISNNIDSKAVKNMYLYGINKVLKKDVEEKFDLKVTSLDIEYDENYENIEKIILALESKIVSLDAVKQYISENYQIDVSNIIID